MMQHTATLHDVSGHPVYCDRRDIQTIAYKLAGLPYAMRQLVASHYSSLYQSTYAHYLATYADNAMLANREARNRANAYFQGVREYVKAQVGKDSYLETHDRLKLEFLHLWEQNAPASSLLDKEHDGTADEDTTKELMRARRSRRKAIKAFCARENVPYPNGTNDSAEGNGTRFNRLVSNDWWKGQLRTRTTRANDERARASGRIGKHGERFLTDEAFAKWQENGAAQMQYINDTVFISHEDDEVEMLDVYNSTTANPKNRKTQLITQISGMAKYAEKHGYVLEMITPTAASEHHPAPYKAEGGAVILNPKFAPKWTAKKTHEHLNTIGERVFSALDREGIAFFGYKGIEAHKDGTPHHHYGLFFKDEPGNRRKVRNIFKWYFQELDQITNGGEVLGDFKHRRKITKAQAAAIKQHLRTTQPGADTRRVTFVEYNPALGSLSNYILKSLLNYVIKDVAVGADDTGKPEELTPKQEKARIRQQRTAAWASLHGIKQFTTLRTGASIGVYQELRRIHNPVDGSTQLEQERLACVGSYGTADHDDKETRVDADFCRFMELRRNPAEGCEPVTLWKTAETESDHITIKLGEYSDELGRVQGVRCNEEDGALLEINTRPIKWRAVNVPQLMDDLVNRDIPGGMAGDVPDSAYRAELTEMWAGIVSTARTEETLHELARGMYHYPLSAKVGIAFRDRVKPVTTWKIRNNPTFSPGSAENAQSPQEAHDVQPTP